MQNINTSGIQGLVIWRNLLIFAKNIFHKTNDDNYEREYYLLCPRIHAD